MNYTTVATAPPDPHARALAAATVPFPFSVLTSTRDHASKWLVPDANGKPICAPAHTLGISAGSIEHVQAAGLAGLADLLQRMTAQQALVHGVPKGSHPGLVLDLDTLPDVTAEERAEYARLVAEAHGRLGPIGLWDLCNEATPAGMRRRGEV